jgi:hypothetical protein
MVTNGVSDGYQNNADLGKGVQKGGDPPFAPHIFSSGGRAFRLYTPRRPLSASHINVDE